MYDLRIWEIEAGGLLQIQGQSGIHSMRLHFKTPNNNNNNNIQKNKKFVYQDSLKNKVCQFWILFPICMGSI